MASNERRYRHVKYTHDLPRASSTVNTMADILTACPPPPDQDISYSRRPTGNYLPRPQPYHRVPTTPISSLANSATTGDLSKDSMILQLFNALLSNNHLSNCY